METTNTRIKHIVLRRARFIRAVRPLFSSTVLALSIVLVSLYALAQKVWLAHVVANMPAASDVFALLHFFESALMNTSFAVQVLSLMLAAGVVWIARDVASVVTRLEFALQRA